MRPWEQIMLSRRVIFLIVSLFLLTDESLGQSRESPIRIFGYFQNTFEYHGKIVDSPDITSFLVQQLNLFLQKDFNVSWTAFINFEILNNYSSIRNWGTFNLQEAWVRYRASEKFNLKLGLQIPIFNNLNEIKNRTPVLPYIIRPLMYETSFNEIVDIDEAVPAIAFMQVYGFLPSGGLKLDYAAYVGNSSNVNENKERGQTGLDTTTTFLFGGRVGMRFRDFKIGLSATFEKRNDFVDLSELLGKPPAELRELPQTRIGGDFSFEFSNLTFESEFISADVFKREPEADLDGDFYYATLGYHLTDRLYVYGSYWVVTSRFDLTGPDLVVRETEDFSIPNAGLAYNLTDRIRLKAQYAWARDEYIYLNEEGSTITSKSNFDFITAAVSVFF